MEIVLERRGFQLTAFHLKVIAMVAMLLDHAYKVTGIGGVWMTYVGRLAFPIFAFQLVEGYFHTKNYNKYCKRILLFALVAEIPFNLAVGTGGLFYPFHQNVLWTLLIGLIAVQKIDKVLFWGGAQNIYSAFYAAGYAILAYIAGACLMVDYGGWGVWMILLFYMGKRLPQHGRELELLGMIFLNLALGGTCMVLPLFGREFLIPIQCFAILSLFIIWLYKGEKGYSGEAWTKFCYWFYPLHLMALRLIAAGIS